MAATTVPPQRRGLRRWQWLVILFIALMLAAFLLGYIPEYQKADKLGTDLRTSQADEQQLKKELQLASVREQFSRAYLETSRNNFGLASQYATRGFDQVSATEPSLSDQTLKSALQEVGGRRAAVLAELAKTDSNSRIDLAGILDTMSKAVSH